MPASDKEAEQLTTAYQALLGFGLALAVAAFALKRARLRRMKPALLCAYSICAVIPPLVGGALSLPHGFFDHVWGAPLLLGLALAGSLGIFVTVVVSWLSSG